MLPDEPLSTVRSAIRSVLDARGIAHEITDTEAKNAGVEKHGVEDVEMERVGLENADS